MEREHVEPVQDQNGADGEEPTDDEPEEAIAVLFSLTAILAETRNLFLKSGIFIGFCLGISSIDCLLVRCWKPTSLQKVKIR